jgi:hypothetical protein
MIMQGVRWEKKKKVEEDVRQEGKQSSASRSGRANGQDRKLQGKTDMQGGGGGGGGR